MTRRPWTEIEVDYLASGVPWDAFHATFPQRTYDSWEVKRRRVLGGTAGSNKRSIEAHRKAAKRAERALRVLADFCGVDLG